MNPVLTIDPEFEAKCPPLTEDELSQLEENILEEGLVLMPLIVWNDTIVDGHNRYRIAQAHPGIEFRTHEKQFSNRYEALSWICKNQLGRRNLTPQQKKYLIGQRYDAEKKTHGGDRKSNLPESSGQNDHLIAAQKTRERIASETGTSESYVKRADQYAKVWTPLKKCFRASRMTCCSESLSPEKPMWRLLPAHPRRSAGKKRNSSG